MNGIIIVNKPADWTSFDVVAKIRALSKVKKVGHSGTLDPMATGVLPVFLGRATKSIQYFMGGNKGYIAEMTLGIRTDTLDAAGKEMSNDKCRPRPEGLRPEGMSNDGSIIKLFEKFTGEIEQTPPMYSAVKIKGQRLYKLARKGITVKREPRKITIHSIKLLNFEEGKHPKVTFEVYCSKGTYVRQLVSDIGDDLGCGAHLSKLMRIYAQPFHITQAVNMETIITLAKIGRLESIIVPVEEILSGQEASQTGN
ncbi:MAG: tRNA pseudouridine(55) synthase TruB [Candidatus Margulisbacteria bacterium]|nr:tRNA pseudouridine(55) synthase TruB [Candidatus Margulisiibacteriota bacterium]